MNRHLLLLEFWKIKNKKNISIFLILIAIVSSLLTFNFLVNKNTYQNKINEYNFEINSINTAIQGLPKNDQTKDIRKELIQDLKIKKAQINYLKENDWKSNLKLQIKADEKMLKNINEGKVVSGHSEKELEGQIKLNKEFIKRDIEPMKNDAGTEGIYFSKTIMSLFYSLIGIIIITILFGNSLASEIEKKNIRLLFTQPISKVNILVSKYLVSILGSCFTLTSVFLFAFVIGSIFFSTGDFRYPILINNNNDLYFLSITNFLFDGTILFIFVIIFIISLIYLLSVITENSMLSVGITLIIIVFFTTLLSKFEVMNAVSHLLPFSYINSLEVINGEAAKNNSYINLKTGIVILFLYSVIFNIITWKLFKKKEFI